MTKWYEFKSKAADVAEIWIYDYIGQDFWTGGGVTAKNFQKELAGVKASQIDLHINSPGGDVFDGITIYNLLKQHPANVTTYIDGLAASIASVIALAGNQIYMAENALFMIHNPWGMSMGDASDMRKMADNLDKVRDSISISYTSKTGKPAEEITALMDAETWMDAEEAMEFGFVDDVTEKMDMAACAKFVPIMAKAGFKKIPEAMNQKQPTVKDAEKALRDVGFSKKAAKTILAKGITDDLRDVDHLDDEPPANEPLRDVEVLKPAKKDRVADLLVRAELAAPSLNI